MVTWAERHIITSNYYRGHPLTKFRNKICLWANHPHSFLPTKIYHQKYKIFFASRILSLIWPFSGLLILYPVLVIIIPLMYSICNINCNWATTKRLVFWCFNNYMTICQDLRQEGYSPYCVPLLFSFLLRFLFLLHVTEVSFITANL